ncbi:hypothetical protein BKI49_20945 [Streptomyces sp. Tue6028]|uniref:hypothetical protein n=1 Tax=Streptomyces sp. Tue6028 TaxID=2036037 RepID=UPI000BB36B97|nr:hypothetical protein [Streptomyces sp. Tue6028]PBC62055.1 hypothetical protein BKI49_20945 [Streptomyces sp. Tue6028]
MATWQPAPGETLLARTPGCFATGTAVAVAGMRWFRDTERNDIQHELTGWPEGPDFTIRSKTERRTRAAGGFAGRALALAVMGAVEALASAGSVGSSPRGTGSAQDRANEVEDFPVLWAAPGTLARTLPWQLDPGRCPEDYRTHVLVTDRRVLVVGFPDDDTARDEVLWETDRDAIARVERRTFTRMGVEAQIVFADESWCRLAPPEADSHWEVVRHLAHASEVVPLEALTPGQREAVTAFAAEHAALRTVVTRRPSGHLTIEAVSKPIPDPSTGADPHLKIVGSDGEPVKSKPGDL